MKKFLTARYCGIASLLVTAVFIGYYLSAPEGVENPIGSKLAQPELQSKEQVLGEVEGNAFRATKKVRGSLDVKIKAASEFEVNEPLVYRARITAESAVEQISFKWIVPDGMELLSGPAEGFIGTLTPGEEKEVEITLKSLVDENRQIHIQVTSDKPGLVFSATDQFNSKDQAEIDAATESLHEITKEASKEEALQ